MSFAIIRSYKPLATFVIIIIVFTSSNNLQSTHRVQTDKDLSESLDIVELDSPDHTMLNNKARTNSLSTDFISTWNTAITYVGSTGDLYLKLPLESTGTYNFVIDWGDGTNDTVTQYNQSEKVHLYSVSGVYTLTISGIINGWSFGDSGDNRKIIEISQWGNLTLGNSGGYFDGCSNLVLTASDAPDLSGTTTLFAGFRYATKLGSTGTMSSWDVSEVTDMSFLFYQASTFNISLNSWDVSKVTNMESMFEQTDEYNQPMDSWNVSSVTTMESMFYQAISFNQSINSWDVSSVTNMYSLFHRATDFNQELYNWNVSSVTDMRNVFNHAISFSKSINSWNTSRVTNMAQMFWGAKAFNQPLDQLDVSSVLYMSRMFYSTWNFNQPLNSWDVSSVTTMGSMFYNATSFNQPLDNWDVSSVRDMQSMFYSATSFDQNIGMWNIESCQYMSQMFRYATLHPQNYNKLLIGWSQLNLKSNVYFHGGNSQFLSEALSARIVLTDTFSWNIMDGGLTVLPEISQPSDLFYIEGETGNIVVWSVGVSSPDVYNITIEENILTASQSWTNGTITQNVDGLSSGVYKITLYVFDTDGKMNYDQVIVTVSQAPDNIPPGVSSPPDAEYTSGTSDLSISWVVDDSNPGTYNITRNGTFYLNSQIWTNGIITLNITGLIVGIHEFTLHIYDLNGNEASDIVIITIREIQTQTSTTTSSTSSTTSSTTSTTSSTTSSTSTSSTTSSSSTSSIISTTTSTSATTSNSTNSTVQSDLVENVSLIILPALLFGLFTLYVGRSFRRKRISEFF